MIKQYPRLSLCCLVLLALGVSVQLMMSRGPVRAPASAGYEDTVVKVIPALGNAP
jgi:hypothetical protein